MKEWTFKWASPQATPAYYETDSELAEVGAKQRWSHMDHVVLIEDGGWAFPGVALCSGQDRYSKRKGWLIARGRARLAWEREVRGQSLRKALMHAIRLDGPLNIAKARDLASSVHVEAHARRTRDRAS